MDDRFPASEFDEWAPDYDNSTAAEPFFPFEGYTQVLNNIVTAAAAASGQTVLDLGTGTANLALLFARQGCDLWCTDFSTAMLELARQKLPQARFVCADLRAPWPPELERPFDRIVSAYVFHHFPLPQKVQLIHGLVRQRLAPGGRLVIGDISFPDLAAKASVAEKVGSDWEEEEYWLADESVAAIQAAGLLVRYQQISSCAGVYSISNAENTDR